MFASTTTGQGDCFISSLQVPDTNGGPHSSALNVLLRSSRADEWRRETNQIKPFTSSGGGPRRASSALGLRYVHITHTPQRNIHTRTRKNARGGTYISLELSRKPQHTWLAFPAVVVPPFLNTALRPPSLAAVVPARTPSSLATSTSTSAPSGPFTVVCGGGRVGGCAGGESLERVS